MEITLPISSILIIAIGSIGISIAFSASITLVIQKKCKHISEQLIILFLTVLGCTLLNEVITTSGIANRFRDLYFIPILFSLSIAPLFYLFIKSKVNLKLAKSDLVHVIIPIAQFGLYLFIGFRDVTYKSELWSSHIFRTYSLVEAVLFPLSMIFYTLLSFRLLQKKKDASHFWKKDQTSWLMSLTKVVVAVSALEVILLIVEVITEHRSSNLIYVMRSMVFTILILWVTYHIMKMLNPPSIYKTPLKSSNSVISVEESLLIKKDIVQLFERDKIHLNSQLNLSLLSQYLNITDKKCSYFLSEELKSNFNQLVNSYRVEEFKEKLKAKDHERYTLLSIAYESGFPSKSTFNRAFRAHCGVSPSDYIKSSKSEQK